MIINPLFLLTVYSDDQKKILKSHQPKSGKFYIM